MVLFSRITKMKMFNNNEFESFYDRESGAVFSDMQFSSCYFESCALSITGKPSNRSTVRNIRLLGCGQRGCRLDCALVENVLVDGFNTHGQLFQSWGAVFSRVTLRGKIDRLMISNDVFPSVLMDEVDRQTEIE